MANGLIVEIVFTEPKRIVHVPCANMAEAETIAAAFVRLARADDDARVTFMDGSFKCVSIHDNNGPKGGPFFHNMGVKFEA